VSSTSVPQQGNVPDLLDLGGSQQQGASSQNVSNGFDLLDLSGGPVPGPNPTQAAPGSYSAPPQPPAAREKSLLDDLGLDFSNSTTTAPPASSQATAPSQGNLLDLI